VLKEKKKENESFQDQRFVQIKTATDTRTHTHAHTHEGLMRDLRLKEPNYYNNFLRSDGPLFDEILKIVSVIILRRLVIWEKQSVSAFIHYLQYLTTGF